jgi:hypothetical protein
MRGAIPSLPQYVFMAWCLVKHRHWPFSGWTICIWCTGYWVLHMYSGAHHIISSLRTLREQVASHYIFCTNNLLLVCSITKR